MPPTAAGTGIGVAAAGGPGVLGRAQARDKLFGVLCCTLAGTVSRGTADYQSAPLATSLPEKSPLPGCRRLPGHGRPGRRSGEGGTGRLGVVLPSFLPLKSKSSAPGGARAAAPVGFAVSRCAAATGLGGARGLQARRPRQEAPAGDSGRTGRPGASGRISCSGSLGAGRPQGRGRGWLCGGRAESVGREAATQGAGRPRLPAWRFRVRGPAPRRHAVPA
ncbi:hypothetical protein NN561_008998 [Cricetulus griseus]